MSRHNEVVNEIKKEIEDEKKGLPYKVSNKNNTLPKSEDGEAKGYESIYRPDLIISADEQKKEILAIIEVESGAGKCMVGAAFLADRCIDIHKERSFQSKSSKPKLYFVMLDEKSIERANKRFDNKIKKKLKNIEIKIDTKKIF